MFRLKTGRFCLQLSVNIAKNSIILNSYFKGFLNKIAKNCHKNFETKITENICRVSLDTFPEMIFALYQTMSFDGFKAAHRKFPLVIIKYSVLVLANPPHRRFELN